MKNTYQGQIRVGSGYEKVTVQATSWSHARQMLEQMYGKNNVSNVFQLS